MPWAAKKESAGSRRRPRRRPSHRPGPRCRRAGSGRRAPNAGTRIRPCRFRDRCIGRRGRTRRRRRASASRRRSDASVLLDVDVDQVADPVVLVADDPAQLLAGRWIQVPEPPSPRLTGMRCTVAGASVTPCSRCRSAASRAGPCLVCRRSASTRSAMSSGVRAGLVAGREEWSRVRSRRARQRAYHFARQRREIPAPAATCPIGSPAATRRPSAGILRGQWCVPMSPAGGAPGLGGRIHREPWDLRAPA